MNDYSSPVPKRNDGKYFETCYLDMGSQIHVTFSYSTTSWSDISDFLIAVLLQHNAVALPYDTNHK